MLPYIDIYASAMPTAARLQYESSMRWRTIWNCYCTIHEAICLAQHCIYRNFPGIKSATFYYTKKLASISTSGDSITPASVTTEAVSATHNEITKSF